MFEYFGTVNEYRHGKLIHHIGILISFFCKEIYLELLEKFLTVPYLFYLQQEI